jgi:hypothetical protein
LNLHVQAVLENLDNIQTTWPHPSAIVLRPRAGFSDSSCHHHCRHSRFPPLFLLSPLVSTTFKSNARLSGESISRFTSTSSLLLSALCTTPRPAPVAAAALMHHRRPLPKQRRADVLVRRGPPRAMAPSFASSPRCKTSSCPRASPWCGGAALWPKDRLQRPLLRPQSSVPQSSTRIAAEG